VSDDDWDPSQAELPALVDEGLRLCEQRLSGGVGSGIYESVRAQLTWIADALAAPGPPDPERLDALILDVLAARELETSDPEVADVCFKVAYLVKRHEWPVAAVGDERAGVGAGEPSGAAGGERAAAVPDERDRFAARLAAPQRGLAAVAIVVLLSGVVAIVLALLIPDATTVAVVVLLLFGLVSAGVGGIIGWIVVSAPRRRRALLAIVDREPERLARVYAAVIVSQGLRSANLRPIAAPEAEHLPARGGGFHVVIELRDPSRAQRWVGVHSEAVAVARDEVLPLLAWLRSRAPGAAGPPDVAGIVKG
jgi:hypothetical protein